ncbi:MAG: class I SAM-dependent methyltransferase [archaeon]
MTKKKESVSKVEKKQFNLEHKHHIKILKENNFKKRQQLYKKAYSEFFEFMRTNFPEKKYFGYNKNFFNLYKHIFKGKSVVDYGCGYGKSSIEFARISKEVYGLDVDDSVIKEATKIAKSQKVKNIKFNSTKDFKIPLKTNSVDFVYSNDLTEHLHPDDLKIHVKEVLRILKKGGYYICITPNRFFGPHDISKKFVKRGEPAQGLHLREYSYKELTGIFKKTGFRKVRTPMLNELLFAHIGLANLLSPFFKILLFSPKYKFFLEGKAFRNKVLALLFHTWNVSLLAKK